MLMMGTSEHGSNTSGYIRERLDNSWPAERLLSSHKVGGN
jgi:hypothetical protein